MQALFKVLRQARKNKKVTQATLGKKAGLPQSHISQIESGTVDLRLSSLTEISRLLDLEPMLIPRELVPIVRSLVTGDKDASTRRAWRPDE